MKRLFNREISWLMNAVTHVAALLCLLFVASCSGDDAPPPAMRPQLPAGGGDIVKSIKHIGGVLSCYDWEFTYSDERLVTAYGVVRDPLEEIDRSFSYTSQLSYGPSNVSVSNSNGTVTELRLNSQGCVERMTVNGNIYDFAYIDGRLVEWNKTIFENSLGPAAQYRSSARIEYVNGDLSRIVYTETGNEPVTLTFVPSNIVNRNGVLPEAVAKELGYLSFEHLYYAGLMGRPTVNLVKSISVSYPPSMGKEDYTIDFEYNVRGGNVILCSYHTPDGSLASVNYGY